VKAIAFRVSDGLGAAMQNDRPASAWRNITHTMANKYLELVITDSVRRAQEHYYGSSRRVTGASENDPFTDEETTFIRTRDSFYMATVSESGWPYIQHRGGKPGFLHVLDAHTLAFADYAGNRQMLSTGNLAANDRVSLFLMDYPQRARLKILGHARVQDARQHPELVARLAGPETSRNVERLFLIQVVSFDWNCPKHITPRYTAAEVEEAVLPLRKRISELEARLKTKN
jgi:predicted pyridoxine 5'-phosphate oxidase superfamily flavin-nucleotide-binding protein